jgi:hypothetical protein
LRPVVLVLVLCLGPGVFAARGVAAPDDLEGEYQKRIRPILARHCLECHSTQKKKGDLDLERFLTLDKIRRDLRPWTLVVENLDNGEMPPKKSPQPAAEDRRALLGWVRDMLRTEAQAAAGDPGRVVARRLSNAEYNNTIRDLTGIDLEPARDFPVDGAAGEGFTNAGDALVMSPALFGKYLAAAKEMAAHSVLLPDGFRFSLSKTRRDWTDESLAELKRFFSTYTPDGRLAPKPYLAACLRGELGDLNRKYYEILKRTLEDKEASFPLDRIRARWKAGQPGDLDALVGEIAAWQGALFKSNKIGSYGGGKTVREEPNNPPIGSAQTLRIKPPAAKGDVALYLAALELVPGEGTLVWERPRLVSGAKPPLLLKDYPEWGLRYEADLRAVFSRSAQYLAAAVDPEVRVPDSEWLKRWTEVLALDSRATPKVDLGRMTPVLPVDLLDVPIAKNEKYPRILGWRSKSGELPSLLSNASDKPEQIPGRASPHRVVVHPSPDKYVAAAWECPADQTVKIDARISHAHPGCGNGIAWWIEVRRELRGAILAEGTADPGATLSAPSRELALQKGDLLVLAVDPRDNNHVCDLTEINLSVRGESGAWDLSKDVADTILAGNPHGAWRFVQGPALRGGGKPPAFKIPPDSALGKWRAAAIDPGRRAELPGLAQAVQALLTGERPAKDKSPDQVLYDSLSWVDGPLLVGIDPGRLLPEARPGTKHALEASRFNGADLEVGAREAIELRLPASVFRDYEFVVDARLGAGSGRRVVQFRVLTAPPRADLALDGKLPLVGPPSPELERGFDDFRRVFPPYLCFFQIVPTDETVCLKLYHREDEALARLFLDEAATRRLDRLWEEHRFITQWPLVEHQILPQFIGYTTQDAPKDVQTYFLSLVEPFRKRAVDFERGVEACQPRQLDSLLAFAGRAYRRPLKVSEESALRGLYGELRKKEMSHPEAFRTVLARILVAPSFLFRLEGTPEGREAQPVSDPELATRLSYFLWATLPDPELARVAREGRLHEPAVLAAQVDRMLQDPKVRGLAVEFAAQWIHVRDLRQNREKNEKLFPMFDEGLRQALLEESVRFFQYLFQEGRPLREVIDADYTFLNDRLAGHYGIPGVKGASWRRVDGVRRYGRGGLLSQGSVLAKESGASRTSPVLRGNWLVDTLLGEKLPKPPPTVPRLPEEENASEGTVREMVARHTRVAECAVCHVRIDPFGFALEKYDPIGRLRERDLGGRPIDVAVKLKDGTEFEGMEGLREYVLKSRWKEFQRTFARKLLGYALGRSVTWSDQPLLEELFAGEGTLSQAVQKIAQSRQFCRHRGLEATRDE